MKRNKDKNEMEGKASQVQEKEQQKAEAQANEPGSQEESLAEETDAEAIHKDKNCEEIEKQLQEYKDKAAEISVKLTQPQ